MRRIWFVAFLLSLMANVLPAIVPPTSGRVPLSLRPQFDAIQKEYSQGYWAARMRQRVAARSNVSGASRVEALTNDTVNFPVLLGTYSNSNNTYPTSNFQQLLFDGPNPTGTVTQFYKEISYGQMTMTGKAMGWFTLPRTFDYYAHDGSTTSHGLTYGGPDFTIDILVAADSTIDFSQFVKYVDAEGAHVPQLAVIHTGADAAAGADNIWSHRWNIRARLLTRSADANEHILDKSRILSNGHYRTNDTYQGLPVIFDGDYALEPEMLGNNNSFGPLIAIGVFAHEFGHIFGLPDLYDRDNSSEGLGNWCLMAAGSYGGDGNHEATPAHMSAWCKEQLGWITPTVVTKYLSHHAIHDVERNPEMFKLYAQGKTGHEYFLIENREKESFDLYLANSGLLIYHIDSTVTTQNDNENHQLDDLMQADGNRDLNNNRNRGDAGDPYPGTSNNHTFDGFSNPNSQDYTLQQTYVGVRGISNADTTMYADLDVGTRAYMVISSLKLNESGAGNNNGRVDPGETGNVHVSFSNVYPTPLSNGTITLTTQSNDVVLDTAGHSISVGSLASGSYDFISGITVKASANPKTIAMTANIKTSEATFSSTFDVVLGYPSIVLVDMDSVANENTARYYSGSLQTIGKDFEQSRFLTSTLQNMALSHRRVVIWSTGRKKTQTIPDSLADSLTNFLAGGGKLFLTGQNIAEDLSQRNSPLQNSVLHASWSKNISIGRTLYGIPSDVIGAEITKLSVSGTGGAGNQTSPDELSIDTTAAHPSFRWNSQSGTSYGGLWWQNPSTGSEVVFWSFGFEAINDSIAGSLTHRAAMSDVLNWFDGSTSTPELTTQNEIPRAYQLYDNYPNPFNPSTTIRLAIPQNGFVTLKVYDVLGREVQSLISGQMEAGVHSLVFDGSRFSSGLYFYELNAGKFRTVKKMLLVK